MPRHAFVVGAFATAALVAAACGGDASSPTSSAHRQSIPTRSAAQTAIVADRCAALFAADASHRGAIAEVGPVDGLLRSLRGNAVYLAAGIDLVRGIHDVREALLAANPDAEDTQLALTLAGGDCSADGNLGFSFGWLQRMTSSATTYGTYMAVWERGEGEDFRITAYYTRSSPFPHIPARAGFPLFLGGAGADGVPHAGGLEEHRRSVAATDREFAATSVAQGYSVAFPAYANPDFLMVFGRNFVGLVGETEIASAYAGWTPSETLDWAPVYVGAAASGDLAYTIGNALDTYIGANGTVMNGYSKYLSLWARTADGVWNLIADGSSPNPSPVTGEQP